jgi:hypothetical protein
VNLSLELAVYRNRPSCGIDGSFEKARETMLNELDELLGVSEAGESREWLTGVDVVLLTPHKRAQLMLYRFVKLTHAPEGERREITDSRPQLREIYERRLRGGV